MKKLFAVLFCTLVMSGTAFAEEPSYEIDPVATAKAPWKVGDKLSENFVGGEVHSYLQFLGITTNGYYVVQIFFSSNNKLSDPFVVMDSNYLSLPLPEGAPIDGVFRTWRRNGSRSSELNYTNGVLNGSMTLWCLNEELEMQQQYYNGEPTGTGQFWDCNGNIVREVNY